MATIVARGNKWQAVVRRKGFKTESKTFHLKAHAEAWARSKEYGIDARIAGVEQDPTLVKDVLIKFRDEISPTRKGEKWESLRIDMMLRDYAWVNVEVSKLDGTLLREWRDERLKVVTGSTVNREIGVLGGVFSYAIKEGWINIKTNPVSLIRRPLSNKPRSQRITDAQLEKIVGPFPTHELKFDKDYVAYAAWFAVETAMRQGEICQLTWSDIDVENRTVHVRDEWSVDNKDGKSVKNGNDREVPLSRRAATLINTLASYNEEAPMDALVFNITKASLGLYWRTMAKTAELNHIHFHDLRREATTRMASKITNVLELSAITGHRDLSVLSNVYYRPKAADLAARLD